MTNINTNDIIPLKLTCPDAPSANPNFANIRKAPAIWALAHFRSSSLLSKVGISWRVWLAGLLEPETLLTSVVVPLAVVVVAVDMVDWSIDCFSLPGFCWVQGISKIWICFIHSIVWIGEIKNIWNDYGLIARPKNCWMFLYDAGQSWPCNVC